MDILYEYIIAFGLMIYAENAVFETMCLVGALLFALLTIHQNRKCKIALQNAHDIMHRLR
jgi:hypothetical protein